MKKKLLVLTLAAVAALSTVFTGCGKKDDGVTVVNVGARYDDAEVWEAVNENLKPYNIRVENKAYDSSVNLNDLVLSGDIDLNVAQHYAYYDYIKTQDEKYSKLQAIGEISISTIDLYSKKYASVEDLPDGAVIAIPNDINNGGRALSVLEKTGLIKLADDHGEIPLKEDIVENPKNIKFEEIASSSMISILDDVDAGFVYSPNAADAGLNPANDAIFRDELDLKNNPTQSKFIIIFTGEEGDENNEVYKRIIEEYHKENVFKAYKSEYKGSTIPVVDGEAVDLSQY